MDCEIRPVTDRTLAKVEPLIEAYQRFYEGVVASLRTGAPPPVDAGDAVRVLELLESLLTP